MGDYFYDVQAIDTNGEKFTFVEGRYKIEQILVRGDYLAVVRLFGGSSRPTHLKHKAHLFLNSFCLTLIAHPTLHGWQ